MKLSIVVPIYNAQKIILRAYNLIKKEMTKSHIDYEILFRNDCSKDNSYASMQKIASHDKRVRIFSHKPNMGLGYTLRKLFNDAKGDLLFYVDADLSFDISSLPIFLKEIKNYDAIIASKYRGMERKIPLYRLVASRVYNLMNKILFNLNVDDPCAGFVMLRKDVIKNLNLKANGFDIHIELFSKLGRRGYKVKEVPVKYFHNRREGSFKVLKHGPKTLLKTFKIYWELRKEK